MADKEHNDIPATTNVTAIHREGKVDPSNIPPAPIVVDSVNTPSQPERNPMHPIVEAAEELKKQWWKRFKWGARANPKN